MAKRTSFNTSEIIAELQREANIRKRKYPQWVNDGSMTQKQADEQLGKLEAAITMLKKMALAETGTLFAPKANPKKYAELAITLNTSVMKHQIQRDKYSGVAVKAEYFDGNLASIVNIESASVIAGNILFTFPIPNKLTDLEKVQRHHGAFKYDLMEVESTQEKIAVFCMAYKAKFGERYVVHPKDGKRWKESKHVEADPFLLAFYMETKEFPCNGAKSIADYIRNYQECKQLYKQKTEKPLESFPNYPDYQLLQKMSQSNPAGYSRYCAHLRKLGYVKKQTMGSGSVWRKEASNG